MDKDKKVYLEAAKAKQEAGLEFLYRQPSCSANVILLLLDDLPGAIEEYTKGNFTIWI